VTETITLSEESDDDGSGDNDNNNNNNNNSQKLRQEWMALWKQRRLVTSMMVFTRASRIFSGANFAISDMSYICHCLRLCLRKRIHIVGSKLLVFWLKSDQRKYNAGYSTL
jgi:hypothetical protein